MSETLVYKNGEIELAISVDKETIWLSANDIASIFDVNRPAIVKHIGNIYKSKELHKKATCSILEQLAQDGRKRMINFYNLDMIISVGYRVNSLKATKFRQWANGVLKEYISSGYSINQEKITQKRLLHLEEEVLSIKQEISLGHIKPTQGIFYDGEVFDAHNFVANLIRDAKKSIVLIDNFVDDSVLTLLSKNQNITVSIYTQSLSKQLKLDLEKYNKQYSAINIKIFKNSHDRFMIIDEDEVYHIGASLKDLGKKWFAFSKFDKSALEIFERLESK